jgi:glycosyltransferase involved in cell wall biosynthesis
MNILFIGTTDNRGGAGRLSMSLAEGLASHGHTVKHIVGYKYTNQKNVYELKRFSSLKTTLLVRHLRSFVTANDIDFGIDDEILLHPWFKEADIISLHNKHANFVTLKGIEKIAKLKPTIWTLHDMWPITSHCAYTKHPNSKKHDPYDCDLMAYPPMLWNSGKKLYAEKERILSKAPITYVAPSQWLQERFVQSALKGKPIHLIPNGIDDTIFKPIAKLRAKRNCGLREDQRYALFIAEGGEKNNRKGIDTILKLAGSKLVQRKKIQFLIIGGSRKLTKGNCIYIPRIDDQKMLANYYSSADVFLFPSLADNCPLTVLESLAVGTKVLAFNTCGVSELLIHKKTGYIADLGDTKDFEKGFSYLIHQTSKQVVSLLPSRNKENGMVKSYEKLMNSILAKK